MLQSRTAEKGSRTLPSEYREGDLQQEEVEYPLPGSTASCDACGDVVSRYYHCRDCAEPRLFDLCTVCTAAAYLKKGTPNALRAGARAIEAHPGHKFTTHRMVHVTAPARH